MVKTKIGIVGCGTISGTYLKVAKTFSNLEVVAVADVDVERAKIKAAEYGIPRAGTVAELLADPEITIVVNLTPPGTHAEIGMAALEASKSVYNEKPLTVHREEARRMLEEASDRDLRVGCAPDTFMGAGLQTCRKYIDDGMIGEPVAATAFMLGHGPEAWHPDPEFFYKVGGGPMFDMGPYYLTALVSLLGPVRGVSGLARISFPEREIGSGPKKGQMIKVDVPTHVIGLLDFECGVAGTIINSFDVWKTELPRIEIYGSKGTLSVPDPNTFGGPVRLWLQGDKEWKELPLLSLREQNSRGLGVADMAYAAQSGRPQRASGALAFHVLDIMHSIHDAALQGKYMLINSSCDRPAPLNPDLPDGLGL